jgi:glucokinase
MAEKVTEWISKGITKFFVAVDIGGTNTRVAIGTQYEYVEIAKFIAASVKTILYQLNSISKAEPFNKIQAVGASLAVAGRILDGYVNVTNFNGEKEDKELHLNGLPENLFPTTKTRFLNDLESACYGITFLNNENTLTEYFKILWPTQRADASLTLTHHQYLVLAIGTGLGVGLLVAPYKAPANVFEVLPMEFGHTLITPLGPNHPVQKEESDLFAFLSKKLYDGKYTPEYEDICSGRGLVYCYEWATKRTAPDPEKLIPADVARKAVKEKDKDAIKALELHYRYAARCSQGLAIGLQAKGIFFAGDNQVNNKDFIFERAEQVKQEFLNHTKSNWLDDVPIFSQIKSTNINILGALYVARGYLNQ